MISRLWLSYLHAGALTVMVAAFVLAILCIVLLLMLSAIHSAPAATAADVLALRALGRLCLYATFAGAGAGIVWAYLSAVLRDSEVRS